MSKYHYKLDIRGMHCPLPVFKTSRQPGKMSSDQVLRVIDSGLDSSTDIASFCRETGHELTSTACSKRICEYLIRKS